MKQFNRLGVPAVALFFIAISIFVVNCKKTALDVTTAESGTPPSFASSCGDTLKANNVLGLIRNDHDPVDDRITLIQYHYAQAIRQVAKNSTHLCYMVNAMNAGPNPIEVSVLDLAQGNSAFAAAMNAELRGSVNATTSGDIYPRGPFAEPGIDVLRTDANWDANSYLRSKIVYAPYSYDPVIYFIKKPASCEVGGSVTVLIAQDVDDCDDVAGWRGDDEIVMGENDVQASGEIIIFVGPGKSVYQVNQSIGTSETTVSQIEVGVSERAPGDINNTSRQINNGFRYESDGKSEIRGGTLYYNPGTGGSISSELFFTKTSKESINGSKTFTSPALLTSICPSGFFTPAFRAFCVFYEQDWWVVNDEKITNPCGDTGFDVFIQAKFNHEWYIKDCGVVTTMWPSIGSVRTTTGFNFNGVAKGTFSLARIN